MTLAIASDLTATLERDEFREALERLCVSEWHSGAIQETRVQPIRSRPNRCTVAIVVNSRTGQHELIGKIYADNRADVFDTMRRLSRDGFGTESDNSVPAPFGWLPALRVRLEEKIEGSSMNDVIRTGRSADWTAAAERCGEWLWRFHPPAPSPGSWSRCSAGRSSCSATGTRWTPSPMPSSRRTPPRGRRARWRICGSTVPWHA